MAKRSVADPEKLNDVTLQRVLNLIERPAEGTKPMTKKDACQMLGISYNTTRLDKLLNDFKAKKENARVKRSEKRGKPPTTAEVSYVIQEYMVGASVSDIANALFRGTAFVRSILDRYAVPMRQSGYDYFKPNLIPEGASRDRFAVGSTAYSARYDCMAEIRGEQEHEFWGYVYSIWLLGDWNQFAYTPACELASMDHLKEQGITL